MNRLHFAVPGKLDTRTGGYLYDSNIIEQLRRRGWLVQVHELAGCFPHPTDLDLSRAQASLDRIDDDALLVVDGLALGAMPDIAHRLAARLHLIALVHHPLALETGACEHDERRLWRSEEQALDAASSVIVTSDTTRRMLAGHVAPDKRIGVVRPGTARITVAQTAAAGVPFELLCVATVTPRKGHHVLLDALSRLADRAWRLTCVGSRDRDPQTATELEARVHALGLSDRIVFTGELGQDGLEQAYGRADLLIHPSFMEGYGMTLAEALARGIPIVATTAGAIPETVPAGAGLLVEPGNARQLADAIEKVLGDEVFRQALVAGAREAALSLPTWEEAAVAFEHELGRSS